MRVEMKKPREEREREKKKREGKDEGKSYAESENPTRRGNRNDVFVQLLLTPDLLFSVEFIFK